MPAKMSVSWVCELSISVYIWKQTTGFRSYPALVRCIFFSCRYLMSSKGFAVDERFVCCLFNVICVFFQLTCFVLWWNCFSSTKTVFSYTKCVWAIAVPLKLLFYSTANHIDLPFSHFSYTFSCNCCRNLWRIF